MTGQPDPLEAMLAVRLAVDRAIEATASYGYDEFNANMSAFRQQSINLFREFDRNYSDVDE